MAMSSMSVGVWKEAVESSMSELSLWLTGVALVAGAVLLYLYAPYWGVREVPGPPATPLLGHLPLLAKHGPDVFSLLAKTYGPIFRFHMGRQPMVIVADPELCREVGIKKFKSIGNRSLPSPISASPLHHKGLFFTRTGGVPFRHVVEEEVALLLGVQLIGCQYSSVPINRKVKCVDSRWSSMRNTIISLYQPSHLASLIPTMHSFITSATLSVSSATPSADISFSDLSLRLATDVIGQAAFGVDFALSKPSTAKLVPDNNNNNNIDDDVTAFINEHIYATTSLKMDLSGSFSIVLGLLLPVLQEPARQILRRLPWTADRKIDQTNAKLSRRVLAIVAKREKESDRESKNFLSAILNARERDSASKELFTSDYVGALTYEHLLAGSATTAFTLSSVMYLVSKHPAVEEKLVREIDGFGPADRVPDAEELHTKFPYLDQVIKEAMRFYTVSPLVARETSERVEVGGYVLPKGTWVWLALGVLAKDPKHFPEPEVFRPERFDPEGEEEKRRHPYAHIPFGIGPRACIGQKFSLQEIKLSVIHLYRHYTFEHSPSMESPLQFQYGIVLNFRHGVKLRAIKRSKS